MFGIDAMGALLSALLLFALIAPNESIFGMPANVARALAVPALGLAIYSGSCYISRPERWRRHLRRIALTNMLYCFAIATILISYREAIRLPGFMYFAGECSIIFLLVILELRTLRLHARQ